MKKFDLGQRISVRERTLRLMVSICTPTKEGFLTQISKEMNISRRKIDQQIAGGNNYLHDVGKEYVEEQLRWDGRELLTRLRRLDHDAIPALQKEDLQKNPHEADLDELIPVYLNHPETWRIL